MMMLTAASASIPTFARMFPNFQSQCSTLYTLQLPVASLLVVTGLIATVKHCQTPRSMIRPIVTSMMIVMSIALWGNWTDSAQSAMQSVVSKMNASPAQTAQRYVDVLVSKEKPKEKHGWFGLPSSAQIYEALLWGALTLIGLTAEFIIWAAYILQQFLLGLAYAFAPLFLGFLSLRSTANIGLRYIMGIVGILAWPLGWAAASIGTSNLIDLATAQGLVMTNAYSFQTILAAAMIGGWIILTTLIAPIIIQSAIATGAQIGSALLGGALTAGAGVVAAGATTGATLASGGAGALGAVAGAGAAGGASMAGAAMEGGGTPISGALVQSLAYNLPRNPSSSNANRTDDPEGGGKGTAQPLSYDPNDAGNDRQVEQLLNKQ